LNIDDLIPQEKRKKNAQIQLTLFSFQYLSPGDQGLKQFPYHFFLPWNSSLPAPG